MSRPTLLTDEKLELAGLCLAESPVLSILAAHLDVAERTVRRWHRWGRLEMERRDAGHPPDETKNQYLKFCHVVKKAQAPKKQRYFQAIEEGVDNWQSRAWLLERLWPDEFGANASEVKLLRKEVKELRDAVRDAQGNPTHRPAAPATTRNGANGHA